MSRLGLSGALIRQERPVSRILSCAVIPLGAALPRTLISDLPGGFGHCKSSLTAPGRQAERAACSWRALPSLFGLAPCGVYLAPALQPERCALTAPFHPYPRRSPGRRANPSAGPRDALSPSKERGVAEAVCFLWHWPSVNLQAHVPDVIRHTALRSSDFPPPETRGSAKLRQRPPGPPASP